MTMQDILSFVPKIGDGLSWAVQKTIIQLATWGVSITPLQSKIFLLVILGFLVYVFLSLITFAKKILKWVLVAGIIFLAVSVAVSMFA